MGRRLLNLLPGELTELQALADAAGVGVRDLILSCVNHHFPLTLARSRFKLVDPDSIVRYEAYRKAHVRNRKGE